MAGTDGVVEEVRFIRVTRGKQSRLITFYPGQPVAELRKLLGAIFQGTTGAHGKRPIALECWENGKVLPLSSAARFPQSMQGGDFNWELLVTLPRNSNTERNIIAGFLEDLSAHGFFTPGKLTHDSPAPYCIDFLASYCIPIAFLLHSLQRAVPRTGEEQN